MDGEVELTAGATLQQYQADLATVRQAYGGVREMPDVPFFLFGMGDRPKLLYHAGALTDAQSGALINRWDVAAETIVPPDYTVVLTTADGRRVRIVEDQESVWIETDGQRTILGASRIHLPTFAGHPYASILRVLHQEILVNIVDGRPVPCFFVYPAPWYRDAALMAMVLNWTDNLPLIREWILGLDEPFDRNNAGESEPDNLGQALYLISLVSDATHPLVRAIQRVLPHYEHGQTISGRTDLDEHSVYQTKWVKYGLQCLGLPDPYGIPLVPDTYSALVWWAYTDQHSETQRFNSPDYPYLDWAWDHFHEAKAGLLSNRDYPLTWESNAGEADYAGMSVVSQAFTDQRLCVPHTWHAAEMFLALLEAESINS